MNITHKVRRNVLVQYWKMDMWRWSLEGGHHLESRHLILEVSTQKANTNVSWGTGRGVWHWTVYPVRPSPEPIKYICCGADGVLGVFECARVAFLDLPSSSTHSLRSLFELTLSTHSLRSLLHSAYLFLYVRTHFGTNVIRRSFTSQLVRVYGPQHVLMRFNQACSHFFETKAR